MKKYFLEAYGEVEVNLVCDECASKILKSEDAGMLVEVDHEPNEPVHGKCQLCLVSK